MVCLSPDGVSGGGRELGDGQREAHGPEAGRDADEIEPDVRPADARVGREGPTGGLVGKRVTPHERENISLWPGVKRVGANFSREQPVPANGEWPDVAPTASAQPPGADDHPGVLGAESGPPVVALDGLDVESGGVQS